MSANRPRWRAFLLVGLLAGGFCALLQQTGALSTIELASHDVRFALRGQRAPEAKLVIVGIDDTTQQEISARFPYPRRLDAQVLEKIAAGHPRAIGYDIEFASPTDPANDNRLINAARRAPGTVFATTKVGDHGESNVFGGGDGLAYSRGQAASANFPFDTGATFRRMLLSDHGLVSFPLAIARAASGRNPAKGTPSSSTPWIDFAGPPGTYPLIPFSRVLTGKVASTSFRDKIVIVGPYAKVLGDHHATPFGRDFMAGTEIEANAIATALHGLPLRSVAGWANDLLCLALGLFVPFAGLRLRARAALLLTTLLAVGYLLAAVLLFNGGLIIALVTPLLAIALAAVGSLVLQFTITSASRVQTRALFGRYLPDAVIDQMLAEGDAPGIRLGGTSRVASVLFADLRGFTSYAESRPADQVITVLNRFLSCMTEAVLEHEGTVVSYLGDGVMAVFGAPALQPDHADRAVAAAREMLERLQGLNDELRSEPGGEELRIGIGVCTGEIVAGNIGSERRLEYTAIGDAANTASRLEGMTKETGVQVLIADSTRAAMTGERSSLTSERELSIRGRTQSLRAWTLA